MSISRRNFLKGAATGAAVVSSPWIWTKKSFAQSTPGFGVAKHVLILYAGGGLRSAPLFNADVEKQFNPFGKVDAREGVEWSPGTLLGTTPTDLFTFGQQTQLPPVSAIAHDIAVVAGLDHQPLADRAIQDHIEGDMKVTSPIADAGLLTMIHREHPGYKNGSLALPPFDIGLSNFARGENDFAGYRAIAVQSAAEFAGRSQGSEQAERAEWARTLRNTRDIRYIEKRSPHVQPYLTAAKDAKINSKTYAAALRNPALDLTMVPEAELGGVSNQQLLEVLGAGQFAQGQWGLETAFALRLMQLGVPAISVLRYLYDSHSDENTTYRMDSADLGRQIAGLHFLLHRMRDADGNSMWDNTVVFVVSEFSRDNTDPRTGFNSGGGSDHQGGLASRNQVWPVFGGPVKAKGKRLGQLDPETMATIGGPAMSVNSYLATILAVQGIDASKYIAEAPLTALFT
jgi:hypothetical protein